MRPIEVAIHLTPDAVSVSIPERGYSCDEPALIAVTWDEGRCKVAAVGREAAELPPTFEVPGKTYRVVPWRAAAWLTAPQPPGRRAAPTSWDGEVAVINLFAVSRHRPELLEAALDLLVWRARRGSTLDGLGALVRGYRHVVATRGLDVDEATRDAIAAAIPERGEPVWIDGAPWYGPSPHDFRIPRDRREIGRLAAALVAGAVAIPGWLRHPWRGDPGRALPLLGLAAVIAAHAAHAVWWHLRQQRRRSAQRRRLAAADARAGNRRDIF